MLDGSDHDVAIWKLLHDALDGKVISFSATSREDDFTRAGTYMMCYLRTGSLQSIGNTLGRQIGRRRVIELLTPKWLLSSQHPLIHRRSSSIIQINLALHYRCKYNRGRLKYPDAGQSLATLCDAAQLIAEPFIVELTRLVKVLGFLWSQPLV